jgi:enoyl-CoA hydratase/carnithine racemase
VADRVEIEPRDDGVVCLTLRGETPLNIFDLRMRDELIAAVGAVAQLPDARAVVLRATGPHFSAGADLKEFGTVASVVERRRIRWDRDPWTPLWELGLPVVAALTGVAMGAGLEMSLLCDIRYAAPDTILSLPEPRLGMLPSAGGTQSALRAVGVSRALRLCLLGDRLEADEALRLGLLDGVVADPEAEALALARRLAAVPPGTLGSARRLAHLALEVGLEDGLRLERTHARLAAARLEGSTVPAPPPA